MNHANSVSHLQEQCDMEKVSTMEKYRSSGKVLKAPLHVIAENLGRHVNTVWRFLRDPSPRKKSSVWSTLKTVIATDLMNINCKLRGEPGQQKKAKLFSPPLECFLYRKPPEIESSRSWLSWELPLNCLLSCPLQEFFNGLMGSEIHDLGPELYFVHWRDQGDSWVLGKWLGHVFQMSVTNVCDVNNWLEELYFRLVSLGKNLLTQSRCLKRLKWP